MEPALSKFIESVFAYHEQSYEKAYELAKIAAGIESDSLFYQQAELFLKNVSAKKGSDVYASPEGFAEFIRGGGNVPLYANTSAQLKRIYEESEASTLLDIGVGDGHALLPALSESIQQLDCVEPSVAMLTALGKKLSEHVLQFQLHPQGWQDFREVIEPDRSWDIIQMTFSVHTFLPKDRADLLSWCANRGKQLILVEFDVPVFDKMLSPDVIGRYVSKYELGLAEYPGQEAAMQQFLMPVFFGNFAHDSQRLTFEQPAVNWKAELESAGFSTIQQHPIYDYWWGPAFMLQASGVA
ncbi:MAG: class I SAM-dependent methyltransferase [Anaerolineae bacterium]